ncbi:fungal-specific transcription factor domain-containing protein [Aspergillus karnatakaensis]|uniref:Zn(II)2Cys6 transcription factor n=1 Tax=Aspergillus karnatakaensis TaxID=1810916 RepID=UPI003CCD4206
MESHNNPLRIVPYHSPSHPSPRGRPPSKRSRQAQGATKIKHACTSCREKKTKCSGHQPCVRCQHQNLPCLYIATTAHTAEQIASDDPTTAPGRSPSQPPQGSLLSPLSSTLEEPPQKDQYGHYHGTASGFAFLQFVKTRLASLPSMSLDFSDYPLGPLGSRPGFLPPKSIADTLLRDYFDFGLTTSRFVHEPTLRILYDRLYSSQDNVGLSPDERALVYAVLALGSHYSRTENVFCGFSASLQFYDMARHQVDNDSTKVTLSSLQARLLISHYLLNHSRMHDAWSSFGIIVRQAQALGLHRLSIGRQMHPITREYRKRVFWTIYVYDRILSSIFGRPCALHDDDIDQEECALLNDQDLEDPDCLVRDRNETSFCSAAALIHYARLAGILGDILRGLYNSRSKTQRLHNWKATASDLQAQLLSWQENLPTYLDYVSLPSSAMSTMIQRQMCTLKLTSAHTSLLLFRPFLLYSAQANPQIPDDLKPWFAECSDQSVKAAQMVIKECQYLYDRGLVSRVFWFVNYVQFAAIGTLYMQSCLSSDQRDVRQTADSALAQFPIGVVGDLIGQRYLEILKELQSITRGFNLESDTHPEFSFNADLRQDFFAFDNLLMNYGDPWGISTDTVPWTDAYPDELMD